MTSGGSSGKLPSVREVLRVLSVLADSPEGATQRLVAEELGIPKVEARRRLRAAVSAGLVVETIDDTVAQPGRRLFSLRYPHGREELARLQAQQP